MARCAAYEHQQKTPRDPKRSKNEPKNQKRGPGHKNRQRHFTPTSQNASAHTLTRPPRPNISPKTRLTGTRAEIPPQRAAETAARAAEQPTLSGSAPGHPENSGAAWLPRKISGTTQEVAERSLTTAQPAHTITHGGAQLAHLYPQRSAPPCVCSRTRQRRATQESRPAQRTAGTAGRPTKHRLCSADPPKNQPAAPLSSA